MLVGLLLPGSASAQQTEPQQPALRLIETSAAGLVFELDIPAPTLEETLVDGQLFQRLSLPGYSRTGAAGQPELLQTGVLLGIPTEGSVELRIVDAQVEDLPGTVTIYPSPEQVIQRDPDSGAADALAGVQEQFTWDRAAYAVDQFQPAAVVSLDDTAFIRGQRVARVLIRPVQVNPAQGAVRIYRHLRVEVTFDGAPSGVAAASMAPDLFDATLQAELLNYDQALAWRSERGQPLSSRARARHRLPRRHLANLVQDRSAQQRTAQDHAGRSAGRRAGAAGCGQSSLSADLDSAANRWLLISWATATPSSRRTRRCSSTLKSSRPSTARPMSTGSAWATHRANV
ncbi:MAG: C25 family peptidase propeptide domain-containing protein [Anaerolineae bacterium]